MKEKVLSGFQKNVSERSLAQGSGQSQERGLGENSVLERFQTEGSS